MQEKCNKCGSTELFIEIEGNRRGGQEKIVKIGQVEAKYSDLIEVKLNNNLLMIVNIDKRRI